MTRSHPKKRNNSVDMDIEASTFSSTASISTALSSTSSLPPGPSGLPVVGSAFEYKGPQTNLKWTEQYGPIYYVRMGEKSLVYLNTIELVEKYMEGRNGEQFLDRPMGPAAFGEGLLFGSGERWKNNKRAFMKAMHTNTLLEDMESAVQTELAIVLENLHKKAAKGRPTRIGDLLLPACGNVVSGFLLGGSLPRFCPERESLHMIIKNLQGVDLNSKLTQITLKYPKMREPLKRLTFRDIVDVHGTSRRLQRLIRQWIRQTRTGFIFRSHTSSTPSTQCPFHFNSPAANTSAEHANTGDKRLSLSTPQSNTNAAASSDNEVSGVTDESSEAIKTPTNEMSPGNEFTNLAGHSEADQQEGTDEDSTDSDEDIFKTPITPGSLTKHYISTESLLTVPKDDTRAEEIMQNEAQLTSLGFSSVAPGEQPFEPMEPSALVDTPDCPKTPITEFQWQFGREMSINEQHFSILQRILSQPEFAGVTEENDEELLQSLVDMFFGGVTTVLSALEFVLMYLSKNTTMQMLAQQEIARVLAAEAERVSDDPTAQADIKVTWSMREQMPYLRACIIEGLRLGSVTPSSLPHVASVETEIEDFIIPKNTFVLAGIYSLHRDPKEYLDAHEFRPQRHLDSEGKLTVPRSYRPFGVGARRCVGETLAEMELFIFTAAILQEFNVKSPARSKKASAMETHMRIVHRLKDFKCVLEKRK
ncbi:cytochrome p450 [Plakobranchus ocellatus]|uniref:Cytochrome p450 n=1 Tax=Plakobranchus ocellatus TaxID=259542 RepID=A0AAV3ZRS0_9GAST|nr:cytochrome p450 [Plakobranchus ocellatus]